MNQCWINWIHSTVPPNQINIKKWLLKTKRSKVSNHSNKSKTSPINHKKALLGPWASMRSTRTETYLHIHINRCISHMLSLSNLCNLLWRPHICLTRCPSPSRFNTYSPTPSISPNQSWRAPKQSKTGTLVVNLSSRSKIFLGPKWVPPPSRRKRRNQARNSKQSHKCRLLRLLPNRQATVNNPF